MLPEGIVVEQRHPAQTPRAARTPQFHVDIGYDHGNLDFGHGNHLDVDVRRGQRLKHSRRHFLAGAHTNQLRNCELGDVMATRFGHVNDLSPRKKAVIKNSITTFWKPVHPIRLKAYGKDF